jgi:hypothetical protein
MKRNGLRVLLAVLFLVVHATAAGPNYALVMEMANAPGRVDSQKLDESVVWAVKELHLEQQPLPLITVFHVSVPAAKRLGIGGTSLWRNGGNSKRYELWIVGEPSKQTYCQMAVNVLERHFELGLADARRAQAIQSVCFRLDSTVNKDSLAGGRGRHRVEASAATLIDTGDKGFADHEVTCGVSGLYARGRR